MKKILILHTGGTIGMVSSSRDQRALKPIGNKVRFLELVPELSKLAQVKVLVVDNIDSSNVTPEHWIKWLSIIKKIYNDYDGFVVTHGTDSMVYTASAFSFALKNVTKPIVFTGSQRPLGYIRTDGRDNLINSVEMACNGPLEVSLCFGNQLLRANRSTKFSSTDYIAFESFNYPRLATMGVEIEKSWSAVPVKQKPAWQIAFNKKVFCFKIFPGISGEILKATIHTKACEAVVLEAFGSGNVPALDTSVLGMIQEARSLNKAVVIVSQCPHGRVDLGLYQSGIKALNAGALSAGDMTREAAVVKLMHGLGMGLKGAALKKYFLKNICGERL